jgi:hypothetical protein
MPHIEPELADCVFYAVAKRPDGKERIGGTGFIVSRPSAELEGIEHYYAVTNQHVFQGAPNVRVNTNDGLCRTIDIDEVDWVVKPLFDDIVVCDITDLLDFATDKVSAVSEASFMSKNQTRFGMGDDVFMIGLFVQVPGTRRNHPKARFGNISAMANDLELIEQRNGVSRPTHLVDMHSRTGFPGSPVFVFEYPTRVWTQDRPVLEFAKRGSEGREEHLKLFGIHCGQYHD